MTDRAARPEPEQHRPASEMARMLALVAADLDRRGYPHTGAVRTAARALLDLPGSQPGGCRGCGGQLAQRPLGRPRVWCSERCRQRHR